MTTLFKLAKRAHHSGTCAFASRIHNESVSMLILCMWKFLCEERIANCISLGLPSGEDILLVCDNALFTIMGSLIFGFKTF